ncbi:f-box domain-containing protein [Ditylenchus destructor]|nr:f-box domain-containing protein [Ditylenchus destructor]
MNPQPPISVLCFEVIRDIFSNLDRKTLCLMQIVCKRFNLIIEKEFNAIPPYLILHKLTDGSRLNGSYEQIMWSIQIEDNSSPRKTLPTLNKLAKCKFIRFKETYFFFYPNHNFTPMDILPISHVWENGFLKVCIFSFSNPSGIIFSTIFESCILKKFSWNTTQQPNTSAVESQINGDQGTGDNRR